MLPIYIRIYIYIYIHIEINGYKKTNLKLIPSEKNNIMKLSYIDFAMRFKPSSSMLEDGPWGLGS